MNWYFEVQGVSRGPIPEGEFADMVQRGEVPADSLVWKPGLEEWATVSEINPPWLKNPVAVESEPKKQKASVSQQKAPPPKEAQPDEPLPVIEAAVPTEPAAPVREPARSKLKLQAPTPAPEPLDQKGEKGGLLKRVFGFGGRKS